MRKNEDYRAVEKEIRSLELNCANLSMRQFIVGVLLIHYDSDLVDRVTKELYPAIAEHFPNANGKSVERNLRSARDAIIGKADPELLYNVLGFRLRCSISVGDLMDSFCSYMDRNWLWPIM